MAAGVADRAFGTKPGAGIGGEERWQAPQAPAELPKGDTFRKVPWAGEQEVLAQLKAHPGHIQLHVCCSRPSRPFPLALPAGKVASNTCWPMVVVIVAWIAVTIVYIVIRATQSLGLRPKGLVAYGVWVLVLEVLGCSTLMIYALHLTLRIRKWTPPHVSGRCTACACMCRQAHMSAAQAPGCRPACCSRPERLSSACLLPGSRPRAYAGTCWCSECACAEG